MAQRKVRSNPPDYDELTTRQQRGLGKEMNRIGGSIVENAARSREGYAQAAADPRNGADYREKSASRERVITNVMPALANRPITLRTSAERRVGLVERARGEAREESTRVQSLQGLPGAGWYFKHHADVMAGAQGTDTRRAIAASAALSPGKDPDADEVPNAHALMHIQQRNPLISHSDPQGRTVTRDFGSIPSEEASKMFATAAAENDKVRTDPSYQRSVWAHSGDADLATAGRAHAPNVAKGIKALRGEITPEEATTGPKVTAYRQATEHAVPGSAEHIDWQNISQHYVHGDQNQGMLMFSKPYEGMTPKENILSPEHPTAEDTWMHSITSSQDASYKPPKGRAISPAKRVVDKGGPAEFAGHISQEAVGTRGDPSIDRAGLVYAFNNKATRVAANNITVTHNQHGEPVHMPSVMVQEVSWTQQRREANADAPYNKSVRERAPEVEEAAPQPNPEQMSFESTGGRNRISR